MVGFAGPTTTELRAATCVSTRLGRSSSTHRRTARRVRRGADSRSTGCSRIRSSGPRRRASRDEGADRRSPARDRTARIRPCRRRPTTGTRACRIHLPSRTAGTRTAPRGRRNCPRPDTALPRRRRRPPVNQADCRRRTDREASGSTGRRTHPTVPCLSRASAPGDATADHSSPVDAGTKAPPCPADAPEAGATCDPTVATGPCEYGGDPHCTTVAQCWPDVGASRRDRG